ncbi:MAG: S8 family serine peptidase [Thermodesulfobacteriota bacterium]
MRRRPTTVPTLCLAALLVAAQPAAAQLARPFKSELYEATPDLEKVSARLLEARKLAREGKSRAQVQRAVPAVPFVDELPEIEVRLDELTPEVVERMRAIGMTVKSAYPEYARVVGSCDPSLLDEIAAIPQVRTIHPNYRPVTSVGAVTSQADVSIAVQQARAEFDVDGAGVPIGILSDSFKAVTGGLAIGTGCSRVVSGTSSQLTGDLPPSVQVLQDFDAPSATDEGRAMAELVHDLAPGAPLLFHTAFESEAGFASGIDELRGCGAQVIVDDVLYFAEPMFQDGIVAQAAQAAVDAGVPYFTSATNYGRLGVDDQFASAVPGVSGLDLHDFGGGEVLAGVTLPVGCDAIVVLQWAEPFDGTLGPGATTDLDLLVFSCSGGSCVELGGLSGDGAQGCSRQDGIGGDPLEIVSLPEADGAPDTYFLAVNRACGVDRRFRIALIAGCVGPQNVDQAIFRDAQIYGHAGAAGVVAVGAVNYREIDAGGDFTAPFGIVNVEAFSSLGGELPFFFGPTGVPLAGAPVLRAKPEIAAPDGTNTTFFSPGSDAEGDGFPNFFGTSAAAPHAAAVAALVRERNPALGPAAVLATLTDTALDIEAPGFDFLSGFGLIDAVGAIGAAEPTAPTLAFLENPPPGSSQSGIGLVSGWACDAQNVKYQVDGGGLKDLAYGTSRLDTSGVCGDADNGFGALLNWNLLGDGTHTLRVLADGVEVASSTFDVQTLGVQFLQGASGQYLLADFPAEGDSVVLRWQEGSQNFVIAAADVATSSVAAAAAAAVPQAAALGVLENPSPGSFQSGIGVISGWVCSAAVVTLSIDGGPPTVAGYGTSRLDTAPVCGDADNGFGRLINWSLLGDGAHTVTAFADGMPFGEATFTVTTLGTDFLVGAAGEYLLPDFAGLDVTVRWDEAQQNFVIVDAE